jgi:hypothetical protein
MTPVLAASADQVIELVSRARENGTVALADLNAAFDRCELMPDVIDGVEERACSVRLPAQLISTARR